MSPRGTQSNSSSLTAPVVAPQTAPLEVQERAAAPNASAASSVVTVMALQRVAECAESITAADLMTLRAITRPQPAAREVVETFLLLLGYRDAKWSAAQAHFSRPE